LDPPQPVDREPPRTDLIANSPPGFLENSASRASSRVRIQSQIVVDDVAVTASDEIIRIDKGEDRLEAIDLSFTGGAKTVLADT
jgi:hypothetical protein